MLILAHQINSSRLFLFSLHKQSLCMKASTSRALMHFPFTPKGKFCSETEFLLHNLLSLSLSRLLSHTLTQSLTHFPPSFYTHTSLIIISYKQKAHQNMLLVGKFQKFLVLIQTVFIVSKMLTILNVKENQRLLLFALLQTVNSSKIQYKCVCGSGEGIRGCGRSPCRYFVCICFLLLRLVWD